MSNFKGTPGPWSVNPEPQFYNHNKALEINYGSDGECVAEIVHNEYDAVLISHAPEMLEMLKKCSADFKFSNDISFEINALIERATILAGIYKIRESEGSYWYEKASIWVECRESIFLGLYYKWLMGEYESIEQIKEDGFTVFETKKDMSI